MKFLSKLLGAALVMAATTAPGHTDEVTFGFREAPPYAMSNGGKPAGIEFDIMSAALAEKGHTIKAQFFPFSRLLQEFSDAKVAAAAPVSANFDLKGKLSDVYIKYQNIGVSLASRDVSASKVEDLASKRVIAFQNAKKVLGPAFAQAVESGKGYEEQAVQLLQMRQLLAGRADIAIGERRILTYATKAPELGMDAQQLKEHVLFPETPYVVAFHDERIRDDFNAGLKAIIANGTYGAIIAKYR